MGHEDIDKHVRIYMIVFASLLVLTVVTVAISYIELTTGPAIALGLFVASIKASLVACYFMHLIDEKKMILWFMALSVVFFFFCLLIPTTTESLNIHTEEVAIFDKVIEPTWEPYGDHGGDHGAAEDHGSAEDHDGGHDDAAEDHSGGDAAEDHGGDDAEGAEPAEGDADAVEGEDAPEGDAEAADDAEAATEDTEAGE